MEISVVIPAFNAQADLPRQLDALLGQDFAGEWEVIVADNLSTDGTADLVRSYAGGAVPVRLVTADTGQGANVARNAGARAARAPLLGLVDADDEVTPGWVAAMVRALEQHPCVGGRIIPTGGHQATSRAPEEGLHPGLGFLPFPLGANCGLRKKVFEELDGFDESFQYGYDDAEFFWRAQLTGHSLGYAPDAAVRYALRPDAASELRQSYRFAREESRLYRSFRHHGMNRDSAMDVVRAWGWIVARTPGGLADKGRFGMKWRKALLRRSGRFIGSIRHRVVYL